MERAVVRKLKLPNATGAWGAYVVAEDAYGTWFFTPAQSPITWTNLEGKSAAWEFDVLCVIPPTEWYFALWWGGDHPYAVEMSVDVAAPATRNANVWSWVDLEIDLFRLKDGTVGIEDEDEFEESLAAGYISETEKAQALRITPIIEQMLRDHTEPFGAHAQRLLAETVALGLAPLKPQM